MKGRTVSAALILLGSLVYGQVNDSIKTKNGKTNNETKIEEVQIIGRKEIGYKNSESFVGTKTSTPLSEVPQSIAYVTKEVMLDQGAFKVNDVVKNISGINQYSFYNDFSIRGFRVQGQSNSGNMVNGMRVMSSFWKQSLTPHIERVEVLKGPASALFGNASPGGTINSVTKKPLFENRKFISTSFGSWDTFRIITDFTGPLLENKKLLYRLNFGYENSDGFRDLQFSKNLVVAPSFTFLPTNSTRLNLDVVYTDSKGRLDRGQAVFGNGDLHSTPISRSLSVTNDYLNENKLDVTVSLNQKITDKLSFSSIYLNSSYDEDLMEHRTSNAFAKKGDGTDDITKVAMRVFIRKRSWDNQNYNNYFNYDWNAGELKGKLLVGYDYFMQILQPGGSQLEAQTYLLKNGTTSNSYNVKNKDKYILDANGNPATNVAHFDLTSSTANAMRDMSKYIYVKTDYTQYKQVNQGVYVQNQFSYKKLDLLVGLRKDFFTDFVNYKTPTEKKTEQNSFIPRVGLVYKATPNINFYGTWVKGFEPQSATDILNPGSGGPFDPLTSQLLEFGAKSQWFSNRLSATFSVYKLTQNGSLYNAGDAEKPDLLKQIGEDVSKGVELDVYGAILPNWNVIVNYAYCKAYVSDADAQTLQYFGKEKPNAPKNTFNIWTKYTFKDSLLQGLGVGAGYNFVDSRLGSSATAAKVIPVFPQYGLVNAALYYSVYDIQLQLNFNNVFNKTHWVGGYDYLRAFPGQPRNLMGTISYRF